MTIPQTRQEREEDSTRLVPQLIVITFGRLVMTTGLRFVYPFLPAFARGLGVTTVALAPLVSLRGFIGIFSPLFSPLSERYGRRPILALSMVLFALGCAAILIWPAYWLFGLTIAVISLAKVIYDPAMQAYMGDIVPYAQRGKALAVTELSWASAFFLGVPAASFIIQRQGWRAPFLWLALIALGSAFLIWRILPANDRRNGRVTDLRTTWSIIRRSPVVWAASLYLLLVMVANELLLINYGEWMENEFGLNLTSLGLATAVIGAAEISGELLIGVTVDWLGKRPVIIVTGLVTALLYFAVPFTGLSLTSALITLFLLFFFFEMTVVGGIPLMTELIPSARGVVLSVNMATGSLGRGLGALLGPLLWTAGGMRWIAPVSAAIMAFSVLILALWLFEGTEDQKGMH